MSNLHISRGWHEDPFAPECGCVKLPCGHVDFAVANDQRCLQHWWGSSKTIRSSHEVEQCPSLNTSASGDGAPFEILTRSDLRRLYPSPGPDPELERMGSAGRVRS